MFRIVLMLFCAFHLRAQEIDSIRWEEIQSVPATKNTTWAIDRFGNQYLCQDGIMLKYDTLSNLSFKQSIKKLGNIKKIMGVNAMKIWVYSEEQQRLCAFDNTLTPIESCLNLNDLEFEYVAQLCPSAQADRLWILDQVNSRLVQYHISQQKNAIEISNLNGILSIDEVTKMEESGNNLFISDKNGLIYRLDVYGTLIDAYELGPFIDFTVENNRLLLLYEDRLMAMMLDSGEKYNLGLPVPFSTGLELSGMNLYLKTENKILKYRAVSTP
jgi:hypothetical protein